MNLQRGDNVSNGIADDKICDIFDSLHCDFKYPHETKDNIT